MRYRDILFVDAVQLHRCQHALRPLDRSDESFGTAESSRMLRGEDSQMLVGFTPGKRCREEAVDSSSVVVRTTGHRCFRGSGENCTAEKE